MVKNRSIIQARYDKTHCKYFSFKMHIENDADVIEKLSSVPSMQGYIKDLIRSDIARTRPAMVHVQFPASTLAALKEQAEKTGLSVPDLVKLIVSEQLTRT